MTYTTVDNKYLPKMGIQPMSSGVRVQTKEAMFEEIASFLSAVRSRHPDITKADLAQYIIDDRKNPIVSWIDNKSYDNVSYDRLRDVLQAVRTLRIADVVPTKQRPAPKRGKVQKIQKKGQSLVHKHIAYLNKSGIHYSQIAKKLGVATSSIYRWKQFKTAPRQSEIKEKLLSLTPQDFGKKEIEVEAPAKVAPDVRDHVSPVKPNTEADDAGDMIVAVLKSNLTTDYKRHITRLLALSL